MTGGEALAQQLVQDERLGQPRERPQHVGDAGRAHADSSFKLGPGRHCATVRYWPLAQPSDKRDSRAWCFNLH